MTVLLKTLSVLMTLVAMCTRSDSQDSTHVWAVKITPSKSLFGSWIHSPSSLKAQADKIASELGLINEGKLEPFQNVYKFSLRQSRTSVQHIIEVRDASHHDDLLAGHQNVEWASKQTVLRRTKRTGTPVVGNLIKRQQRDVFEVDFNDPKYRNQWHLHNHREKGHDVNVSGIWRHNVTGRGVVVAVVDDGLEYTNVDLTENYEPLGSYDFNSDDNDPTPDLTKEHVDNTHGTRCAGLISAVANNSVCGVGVAHGGRVSGIRMLDGSVTDILEAQSFIYKAHVNHVYSCSWGPEDNGRSVEGPGSLAKEALRLGTAHGRYGYGNIYVFASGNGGTLHDNCNFDGYANSIHTLTIGAVDELNRMPYYAEPCATMLAVTYSNGQKRSIVTTDGTNHGGCTMGFSGTSAAAPIAAGMVALMLQVRPCLTWRDIQAIVVYSAIKVDAKEAQWVTTAAGFQHSDQHGFGLMDTYRLTVTAAVWALLPVMVVGSVEGGGPEDMPALGAPLIRSISVDASVLPRDLVTLEYVAVTVKLSHVCRGSLEIVLTSPSGTHSTLITPRPYDRSKDGLDWTLTSARFWGEGPLGTWTLNVSDHTNMCLKRVRTGGVVHHWTLTFYGSSVTPEQVKRRQQLVKDAVSRGSVKSPFPCPRVNHTHNDIIIPYTIHSTWSTWEIIGLTAVAVVVSAITLRFILDWTCQKVKGRCRPRPSTAVLYRNSNEEACVLLLQEEDGAKPEEGGVLLNGRVRTNGNFNNNTADGVISDCDSQEQSNIVDQDITLPLDDSVHAISQSEAVILNTSLHSDNGQSDTEVADDNVVTETTLLLETH